MSYLTYHNQNLSVTGIAFNLILIRVAQRRVEDSHSSQYPDVLSALQFNHSDVKSTLIPVPVQTVEIRKTEIEIAQGPDAAAVV